MSRYIQGLPDWPEFKWDTDVIAGPLAAARYLQGRLLGQMERLGFEGRREAELETLTADVVKTSEIEGETLNPQQVRSSLARRLGIDIADAVPTDRNVEGVVQMMLATQNHLEPLSKERLFGWQAGLFFGSTTLASSRDLACSDNNCRLRLNLPGIDAAISCSSRGRHRENSRRAREVVTAGHRTHPDVQLRSV